MESSIIVTENLTKAYGKFAALDEINIKINKNTCVGFLGPNGAGKTTLIKILTGLIKPTSGKAYINGIEVRKNLKDVLADVGAIVETPEFYQYLTPYDVLSYFGNIRGIPKDTLPEKIEHSLQIVKLESWGRKKIGKFSKGMKQRLALASAMIHDPSILILDEPTSGLDPRGAIEMRDIIKSLKNSGKTIFFSSHILSEVQAVCDQVILVDKGKMIRHVDLSKIENFNNVKIEIQVLNQITKEQLSSIQAIEAINSVEYDDNEVLVLSTAGDSKKRSELLKKLQNIGLEVTSFKTLDNELESLYMNNISESVI